MIHTVEEKPKVDPRRGFSVSGEPCVLAGQEPAPLLGCDILTSSLRVRSTFRPWDHGVVEYEAERDFTVDAVGGCLCRTPESRIPDYREHVFHGRPTFDLSDLSDVNDVMNIPFTVYVDYRSAGGSQHLALDPGMEPMPARRHGDTCCVVFYGDSITCGRDALVTERGYPWLWGAACVQAFDGVRFRMFNCGRGGVGSAWGRTTYEARVAPLQPDMLILAFGMNDQNGPQNAPGTEPGRYRENLESMIQRARTRHPCSVVLVSPCVPNPRWNHASGTLHRFRDELVDMAGTLPDCRLADVTRVWDGMLQRKRPEDLLANNVNHPNDFGHCIYADVLVRATLGAELAQWDPVPLAPAPGP